MNLRRTVLGQLAKRFTNLERRERRHHRAERRRARRGAPRRVTYFHEVDDPGSALAAQVLERLAAAYAVEWETELVGRPNPSMIAGRHPAEYRAWVRKDAADIAPWFGLEFEDPGREPDTALVERGQRILAGCTGERFLRLAAPVSLAVWQGDEASLAASERDAPPAGAAETAARIRRGERLRGRLGYVYGGTFHYGGEWFLGVDRLAYLESRLASQGAARVAGAAPVVTRPVELCIPIDAKHLDLEFFPSVRSPYSYVAMQRTGDLAARTGVTLIPRPVLPILMRGGYSGAFGQMVYVYADAAREAETHGVGPFDLCECVGRPVERGYSLFPFARERGRGFEYLHAYTRGVFAERVDADTDAGLRTIVERAGLPWEDAQPLVGNDDWRAEIDANLRDLYGMGLWGVPSFRVSGGDEAPFQTWGADRIWLVEREIQRRAARSHERAAGASRGPG